ncbi:MAG: hypothetical protein I8H77_03935 [Comamonadaceae bacterium]|nr:hypothetical protein [Comamonadaceae bacterium]
MTSTSITRRSAALWMLAGLSACGGGGGDDSETPNPGGGDTGGGDPGTGNPGGGTTITGTYSLQPGAATNGGALADANRMGAQGYALVTPLAITSGLSVVAGDFYLSDTAHAGHKLEYLLQPDEASLAGFLAQLNRQGAGGYALKSSMVFPSSPTDIRHLYVKNTSRSDQFSYEALTTDPQTPQAVAEELNRQGARGFRFIGPMIVGGAMFSLYVKRSDGVTYQYAVDAQGSAYSAADRPGLQTLLDAKGADGWLVRGSVGKGSPVSMSFMSIYEKSSVQSGAVQYAVDALSANASLNDMVRDMNTQASKGFFWLFQQVTSNGQISTISVKNGGTLVHALAGVSFP